MERLTAYTPGITDAYYKHCASCEKAEKCVNNPCVNDYWVCGWRDEYCNRLAAYEDTGLEPEQIGERSMQMLDFVAVMFGMTPTHLRMLIEADRDGRASAEGGIDDGEIER